MNAEAMRSLVESARVARFATVSSGGTPHVVPVCFVVIGETVYSAVDHKPKRTSRLQRVVNIESTGRGCLLVDEYNDSDWAQLWWVRLDGQARVVQSNNEVDHALDTLAGKYPQYATTRPTGPVIALDIVRWTGWSAADG